jgi:hypothetical protein
MDSQLLTYGWGLVGEGVFHRLPVYHILPPTIYNTFFIPYLWLIKPRRHSILTRLTDAGVSGAAVADGTPI